METILLLLLLLLLLIFFFLHRPQKNSPPSPTSLPLLGHLHLLQKPHHRSLASLSARHGPVLSLRFGSRPVLLVSSSSAAASCFSQHDAAFGNRPQFLAGKHLGYNYSTLVWSSTGPHWRNLRRIAATEIFSASRLASISNLVQQEIISMVKSVAAAAEKSRVFEIRPILFDLSLNLMTMMVAGKKLSRTEEFREIIRETFEVSGAGNLGDFIPLLRLFDYNGLEKKLIGLQERRDCFLQELVDERRRNMRREEEEEEDGEERGKKCLIDNLLFLQKNNPEQYSDEIIKGLVVVLLSAGTDTTALTTEWALALLLRNPSALSKIRAELQTQIPPNRLLNESDLPNLPFLRSAINETLRLHPVAPLIPAHESNKDCIVDNFLIPKGALLIVNAWAIHRDASLWPDPDIFRPERWAEEDEDVVRGRKQGKILFFGMGRRACPGEGMALRSVGLGLGALVQCFDWGFDGDGAEVDLAEGSGGLSMPMARPLRASCRTRGGLDRLGFAF